MDLIGKSYLDYKIKEDSLDGKSHVLKKPKNGGLINIFDDNNFLDIFIRNNFHPNVFLICNQNTLSFFSNIDYSINLIRVEEPLPTAFIIENNRIRTSFVINDSITTVNNFIKKSAAFCLFYGDKIRSNIFKSYKKAYIDTAGNSYEDLLKLAVSKDFPDNSIVSISKEYLDKRLLKLFLENDSFEILAHTPESSDFYGKGFKKTIKNDFYLESNQLNKNISITGLGDKFFFLVAMYNFHFKIDIINSVKEAQKLINLYIRA